MIPNTDLGHVHHFIPSDASDTVLLMLHGTGADENDLIPLARALSPGAGILSPRGNVLENGMPRFFRRLAEGVFDLEDLAKRTGELATFIDGAIAKYGIKREKLTAVGFSNGANIAASLLLARPGVLCAAMLLSPMVPFEPSAKPALQGTRVFIGAGERDPIVPVAHVNRLAEIFRDSGADLTVFMHEGGHTITQRELEEAKRWLTT